MKYLFLLLVLFIGCDVKATTSIDGHSDYSKYDIIKSPNGEYNNTLYKVKVKNKYYIGTWSYHTCTWHIGPEIVE